MTASPPTAYDLGLDQRPDWMLDADCASVADDAVFFPEKGGSTREAKSVCAGCEVSTECLTYALEKEERFGVWGGLSERERRRLQPHAAQPVTVAVRTPTAGPHACRRSDCGRSFATPQARAMHERRTHDGFNPRRGTAA